VQFHRLLLYTSLLHFFEFIETPKSWYCQPTHPLVEIIQWVPWELNKQWLESTEFQKVSGWIICFVLVSILFYERCYEVWFKVDSRGYFECLNVGWGKVNPVSKYFAPNEQVLLFASKSHRVAFYWCEVSCWLFGQTRSNYCDKLNIKTLVVRIAGVLKPGILMSPCTSHTQDMELAVNIRHFLLFRWSCECDVLSLEPHFTKFLNAKFKLKRPQAPGVNVKHTLLYALHSLECPSPGILSCPCLLYLLSWRRSLTAFSSLVLH
jgi:hypothetical protein